MIIIKIMSSYNKNLLETPDGLNAAANLAFSKKRIIGKLAATFFDSALDALTKSFILLCEKWSSSGAQSRAKIQLQATELLKRGAAKEKKDLSEALAASSQAGAYELLDLLLRARKPMQWEMAPATRLSLTYGKWECARLLLSSGAPAAWPLGIEGAAPLREVCEISINKGDNEGIKILCEHVANWGQEGLICGYRAAGINTAFAYETLCCLWENGSLCHDLRSPMDDEINPLSSALISGNGKAFTFLLDRAFPIPSWCKIELGRCWGLLAKCALQFQKEEALLLLETVKRKWKQNNEVMQYGFDWLCLQGVEPEAMDLLVCFGARAKESSALNLCMSPAFMYHTGSKLALQWDSWSQNKHSDADAFAKSIDLIVKDNEELEIKIAKAFSAALGNKIIPSDCGSRLTSVLERMILFQSSQNTVNKNLNKINKENTDNKKTKGRL